jgi:hypothetical protein
MLAANISIDCAKLARSGAAPLQKMQCGAVTD